jgi:hypothetical protein
MKCSKQSHWLAATLVLVFLAGLADGQTTARDKNKDNSKDTKDKSSSSSSKSSSSGGQSTQRGNSGSVTNLPGHSGGRPQPYGESSGGNSTFSRDGKKSSTEKGQQDERQSGGKPHGASENLPPKPNLHEVQGRNGEIKQVAQSGAVRAVTKSDPKTGSKQTQELGVTGRVERQVVENKNGSRVTTQYALNGKPSREESITKEGTKSITTHQYDRDGKPRAQETVKLDSKGVAVSKTVIVNNTTIVNNRVTVVNNTRYYDRGHYGYVYRPAYVVVAPLWYDPFWYGPTVVVHPFHYSWGWEAHPWYHHYYGPSYWVAYDVYPTPAYWVTDWMVAGYVADHYAASVSAAQAHEEARLAHEEAEKARQAAEKASDRAEVAEAKLAQEQAENRAKSAEARAAKAEHLEANAGKPNPNATPVDKETKEALRTQIEATIAEKKEDAKTPEKGGQPIIHDLSKALAEPKHIYPVSKTTSVVSAKDQTPAGVVTEGDLLKVEPGQDLKNATETTFVTMRVMSSKGEDGEVPAGTLVSVPLREVQEFDNEFRAKLDQGLVEADKNKEQFKKGG